jgi:PAS domain S-box-containing protein
MFAHKTDLANEQRFRNIFETTTNIAVQGYNRFHEVIFWNKASEDLYGFKAADVMGQKLEDLIIPNFMRSGVYEAIENWHLLGHAIPSGEIPLQDKDGKKGPHYIKISTVDNDHQIALLIEDSGCGISKENIKKLFTPFFTTKDVGMGTGLGLATSYRILESWGGSIKVESQQDSGSTFSVFLPKY